MLSLDSCCYLCEGGGLMVNRRYIINGKKSEVLLEEMILESRHKRKQQLEYVNSLVIKPLPHLNPNSSVERSSFVSEKKREGKNIKVIVTDDISHTGLSEGEFKILEEHTDFERSSLDSNEDCLRSNQMINSERNI